MTPDQILVTVGGLAAIAFVAWFFWFKTTAGVPGPDLGHPDAPRR